jgi:HEAT repeat protein
VREDAAGEPAPQPTRSLDDLVAPRRPAGVPSAVGEDHDAEALLTANGHATDTEALVELLDSGLGIFQAAAARLLGARQERSATDALERIARDPVIEETARAQAAYALARMGRDEGRNLLVELLQMSPEASPAPLQAAAALAQLGDPRGFPVVRTALDSSNRVTAMIACKQLHAFVPLDGRPLPDGGRVDVFEGFRRALTRPEANIVGEARAQLAEIGTDRARAILDEHPAQGS